MMATGNGSFRRASVVWLIYREAMPVLFLTVLAELFAGFLLSDIEAVYTLLPGLVILVPGLMQLRGNISTSLAQRLGSGTHLGTISWDQGLNAPLRANIKASFFLVTVMSFSLGIGAYSASFLTWWFALINTGIALPLMSVWRYLAMAMITALLASLVQVIITVLVALISHLKGLDPDNITIPLVAAIGDILTVICLLIAIRITIWFIP